LRAAAGVGVAYGQSHHFHRHPGEGRDLAGALFREGQIPAFAGMTK
jgi:hypothetical protein